ncbi:enoyl-[acyl-carrier-protein] reductase FabV [Dactylosporangium sucinum]|uniref:trans-2-enoyl-CoA reductase (NAD(+)) n=1 Tax=Dactylosporangium sucinum TaxID=1424081 RepID=A0A917WKI3_9ACTN|nr:enoyl-[acyl-carrier-protein] reductase FabV [Dactylosporangium sucinum]GGM12515.1 enoyl-[acyl-carrier-protein] reductase [NADH] [Dactylosporangium sucinum]
MNARVVSPAGKGFVFLDAHPAGCAATVDRMWRDVPAGPVPAGSRPTALVVGCSAGYGLAATIAGLARYGIRGVGVCLEKPPTPRRTATAGWYRVAATAELAGDDFVFVNGDAFSDQTKEQVTKLLAERFGPVDHLIYSVAAPRRTDPDTGETYASVLKPLGAVHTTKTLVFDDGIPVVKTVTSEPATEEETAQTVAVMGGADWRRWLRHLSAADLLADGVTTAALTYIGSPLTSGIYRAGTIGAAKADLEATARELHAQLAARGGRAVTSVNGAAVTQSSTAIPGIALYVGLLRAVLGGAMVSPTAQLVQLWDQLVGAAELTTDDAARVRLDTWELEPTVQAAIGERWRDATSETIAGLADVDWFAGEVRRLYGFDVPGVDYSLPVETEIPWPATS